MAVDAHGMPVRIIVTEGSRNDCTQANELVSNIKADHLIADKAYDTNSIIDAAKTSNINPVISSQSFQAKEIASSKERLIVIFIL